MKIGILGRKVAMTQVFDDTNAVVPVTVVSVGPCVVLQKKTPETDGYHALQIGLVEKVGRNRINKPTAGHLKKAGVSAVSAVRELRGEFPDLNVGAQITAESFAEIKRVNVVGKGKGKGFQGVMKRHGFGGGRATHGSMFHRAPGSIGASSYPSRVFKGTRRAENVTAVPRAKTGDQAAPYVCHLVNRNYDPESDSMEPQREVKLPEEVFALPYRRDLIHEAVRAHRAAQRLGTHSTKRRDEVSGSGKKLWKQKHTGRARMGEIRSPLWYHGGITFGPKPRDYQFRLSRKTRQAAVRSLLSERVRRGSLKVIDGLSLKEPRTKEFLARFGKFVNE
ncbi:MAG: 50S ribosomal protein L3, partial [Acidobacteriota bacterium]